MSQSSQFMLLAQRRFGPFFWTQFLGAFNDNVFKTALLTILTYDALSWTTLDPGLLNNLIQLSPQGEADFNLLARAMADALEDHAERRSRQVEEHYQRKSTASRAHNTRERMAQSISGSPIEALAR